MNASPQRDPVTECVNVDLMRVALAQAGDRLCQLAGWTSRFSVDLAVARALQ